MRRSVVVTGLGVVTPVGAGVEAFWKAICDGTIGTKPITRFDTEKMSTRFGGELHDFDPASAFYVLDARAHERSTQLAVAGCRQAAEHARITGADFLVLADRAAVVMGGVVANRPGLEPKLRTLHERGSGQEFIALEPHDIAWIAEAPAVELGIQGCAYVLPTACAAGNSAIAFGSDLIEQNDADLVLAGGADEISPTMFTMFSLFDSLAPERVQPFDRCRKGLLLSEGVGVLVLEAEEHARARGASIYGRVAGHGNHADAYDMTHPHPAGSGALASMRAALTHAGLTVRDIGYVSAHGTGTVANDGIEARAIRALFGAHADVLPVSSVKSMLGHTQAAASAIEAAVCLLAMRDSIVPPTMNHEHPDPECPIDVVPNRARRTTIRAALNNGFGFGGNICCVAFTAP